jgi:predicted phosphodiesterase
MKEQFKPFPDKKRGQTDFNRINSFIREAQAINQEASVGQKEATWIDFGEYPELPTMFLYATDIHYPNCDLDLLEEHLQIVEDTPNMSLVGGGDYVDNFSPKVIPQGMLGDAISPQLQAQAFMERLLQLDRKGKIGALSWGNHEDFIGAAGYDFYQTWMADFQAPILDQGGIINWMVNGGQMYRIALSHKHWGSSKLNITNASKRQMMYTHGGTDISLTGHTHMSAAESFYHAGEQRVAIVGGTYKQNDSFGLKNFGKPGMPGYVVAAYPDRKHIEVFNDPRIAQMWMLNQILTLEE